MDPITTVFLNSEEEVNEDSLIHAEINLFQLGIMPPDIKYFCDYNMIHVLQVFNEKKNFLLFHLKMLNIAVFLFYWSIH